MEIVRMKMNKLLIVVITAAVTAAFIAGYPSSDDNKAENIETPSPKVSVAQPVNKKPAVDWESYPPSLKQIIDEEASEKDCRALQEMFDIWINAGATDVAKYIHDSLESAGCY
jgi:hypothetical protein